MCGYICNECGMKFKKRSFAVKHLIKQHYETVSELISDYFVVEEADSQ